MENLVRGYEQYTLRTLRHYDQVAEFLKFQFESAGGTIDLEGLVERGLLSSDVLTLASIANEKGELTATTRAGPIEQVSLRDREHFNVPFGTSLTRHSVKRVTCLRRLLDRLPLYRMSPEFHK